MDSSWGGSKVDLDFLGFLGFSFSFTVLDGDVEAASGLGSESAVLSSPLDQALKKFEAEKPSSALVSGVKETDFRNDVGGPAAGEVDSPSSSKTIRLGVFFAAESVVI